jgi:hypothetical protein
VLFWSKATDDCSEQAWKAIGDDVACKLPEAALSQNAGLALAETAEADLASTDQ